MAHLLHRIAMEMAALLNAAQGGMAMNVSPWLRPILAIALFLGLTAGGFLVPSHASAAGLSLSRQNAAARDSVTVHGSGFSPGDTVIVSIDIPTGNGKQHVQTSSTADGSGNVQATLTVPAGAKQGTYSLTARDFHGHSASTSRTILPRAYIMTGGKQSAIWVIPSHSFYVSGAGFKPGESVTLTATFPMYSGNAATVTHTVQADNKGNFYEAVFAAPEGAKKGALTLTATGQSSNKTGKETLHVFYRPVLNVASTTYRPGTTVKVTGSGFAPGASVRVMVRVSRTNGADITITRTVNADGSGNVTAYLPLPSTTRVAGYQVRAHGNLSGATAVASLKVSVKPSISLNQSNIYPGQSFSISGSNFGAGALVKVHAFFPLQGGGRRWVGTSTHAAGNGNYSVQLVVPAN